jgi:hypothetical protein
MTFATAAVPPAHFERDYGCTEAEWLRWLPVATQALPLDHPAPGWATVDLAGGHLHLRWQVLPPRRIALMVLPRLAVQFRFEGVADADRAAFLRQFDRATQRGGG